MRSKLLLNHQAKAILQIINEKPPAEGRLIVVLDGFTHLTPQEAIQQVKDQPKMVFHPQFFWDLR